MKLEKSNNNTIRLESIHFIIPELAVEKSQQEKFEALKDCISLLNEKERAIIILYLEELPYKEIALITGLRENHIAVKMKRIRASLLECINHKIKY